MKLGVWAAVIPILVATVTLGSQLYTGYYQTLSRLAALEKKESEQLREKLAEEKKIADSRLADLRKTEDSIKAAEVNVHAKEKQLDEHEKRLDEVQEDVEVARGKLSKEQLELDDLRAGIASEKKGLEARQIEIRAEKDAIEIKLRLAPFDTHIEVLAKLANADPFKVSPQNDSVTQLIELVSKVAASDLPAVIARFKTCEINKLVYGNLLYVLFKGTGERRWRNELLDLATTVGSGENKHFWGIFGMGDWVDEDQVFIWEAMIKRMRDGTLTQDEQAEIFLDFSDPKQAELPTEKTFSKSPYFDDAVRFARSLALSQGTIGQRFRGILALIGIAPEIAVVTCAQILADDSAPRDLKRRIQSEIESDLRVALPKPFVSALRSLEFPSQDSALAAQWLSSHKVLIDTLLIPVN